MLRTVFDLHASQVHTSLPRMELCGLVRDGVEALEAVRLLKPDVLLLDLEMPRMNGLRVLAQLRALAPELPVIMCSAHTESGARSTLDALSLGAKDYVMKPGQQKDFAAALDSLMEQLLPRIAALAGWSQTRIEPAGHITDPGDGERRISRLPPSSGSSREIELVVIGVSTGGPSALELMLPMLPADFSVPIMIVQHMPKLFTSALAERLDRMCRLSVRQAHEGAAVERGAILLAPGDAHMEVALGTKRNATVKLHQGVPLNSCKPSVDYLFRSAAAIYGPATLGVVMTGMGCDGLEGARAIRHAGSYVLAQDEASSAVWGMPGRVVQAGLSCATFPLASLAGAIVDRVDAVRGSRSATNYDVQREVPHAML
jgi:two-component system chemotaxis response regulator CheB